MSESYTLDQDLRELKAMVDGLETYVREDALYGSVSGGFFGGGNMPALTVGAVLMRLRRLADQYAGMNDRQRLTFADARARHDAVKQEWRHFYEQKMLREANSRLDAMSAFFEECSHDPQLCAQVYRPEVLRRTTVEEILMALPDLNLTDDDLTKKARGIDSRLRRVVQPASFIWADELKPYYPEDRFWWMYQRPPDPQKHP